MKCFTCGAAVKSTTPRPKYHPFCSERCQLIDLGRWLGEDDKVSEPAGTADQSPSEPEQS